MIHVDGLNFKISGTAADVAADFLEIMQELVKAGILDPDNTTAAFLVTEKTGDLVEDLLNDTQIVTVSRYGGN